MLYSLHTFIFRKEYSINVLYPYGQYAYYIFIMLAKQKYISEQWDLR